MPNNSSDLFGIVPKEIFAAVELLEDAGFEAYIVGGCVRDILLGIEPSDYDITTSAKTSEMYNVFSGFRIIPTGERHGTLTVKTGDRFVEITTFRKDGDYKDHRHPNKVDFTDKLSMDLERRDFTVNAMAYSQRTGLIDLFGGKDDLAKRIIKAVGDPYKRFDEDALRILRALRFSAKLDLDVEEKTAEAMLASAGSLRAISSERVYSEFKGIVSSVNTERLKQIFTGPFKKIIFTVIPELEASDGCPQENSFHKYDVYTHSVVAMTGIENDPELRLTMLLHDIGKPFVRSTDEEGRSHFREHPKYGSMLCDSILSGFHTSNDTRKKIVTLILYHNYFRTVSRVFGGSCKAAAGDLLRCLGVDLSLLLIKVMRADLSAKNVENAGYSARVIDNLEVEIYNYIASGRPFKVSDLAVDGDDLIAIGIPCGKTLGTVLNELLKKVVTYEIDDQKDILLNEAAEIYHGLQ